MRKLMPALPAIKHDSAGRDWLPLVKLGMNATSFENNQVFKPIVVRFAIGMMNDLSGL